MFNNIMYTSALRLGCFFHLRVQGFCFAVFEVIKVEL